MTGYEVLKTMLSPERVVKSGDHLISGRSLIDTTIFRNKRHWWLQAASATYGSLGIRTASIKGAMLPISYGSSAAVAWGREDLVLMKAVGEIPWSVGLLTTSRVGGRLSEALQNQQNGWWKNCHQLQALFTERELRAAACQVQPPRWNLLEPLFAEQLSEEAMDVLRLAYDQTNDHLGSWADFVALYRFLALQVINHRYGQGVPMAIASLEDLATEVGMGALLPDKPPTDGLRQRLRKAMPTNTVRLFNFPCPAVGKNACNSWHFYSTHGVQMSARGQVSKGCRVDLSLDLESLFRVGATLSGASIHYLQVELGRKFPLVVVLRNYSKGDVFRIYGGVDTESKIKVLPYGSFYLYPEGGDPRGSIDSVFLLDWLSRGGDYENLQSIVPMSRSFESGEVQAVLRRNGEIGN